MPTLQALSLLLGGLGLVLAGSRQAARGFGEALLDGLLRRLGGPPGRSTALALGTGFGLVAPASPRSLRAMLGASASGRFDAPGALALVAGVALGSALFSWFVALGAGTGTARLVAMNALLAGALCASHGARTRRDGLIGVGLVLLGVEFANSGALELAQVAPPLDAVGLALSARVAVFLLAGAAVAALAGCGVATVMTLSCASAGMLSETSAAGALAGAWLGTFAPAALLLAQRDRGNVEQGLVGHRPETRRVAASSLVLAAAGAAVGVVGLTLCLPLLGELPGSFAQPGVFLAALITLSAGLSSAVVVAVAPGLLSGAESFVRQRDEDTHVSAHVEPCLDDLPVLAIQSMDRALAAMSERAAALSRRMLAGESVTAFRQRQDVRRVEASERALARRIEALVRCGTFEEIAGHLQPLARAAAAQRQVVSVAGRVQSRALAQGPALEPGVAARIAELQFGVGQLIESSRPGRADLDAEQALAQQRAIEAYSRGLEHYMFVQVRAGMLQDVDAAAVLSRIASLDELARIVVRTARDLTTHGSQMGTVGSASPEQRAAPASEQPLEAQAPSVQPANVAAPTQVAPPAPPAPPAPYGTPVEAAPAAIQQPEAQPQPPAALPSPAVAPAPLFAHPSTASRPAPNPGLAQN